MKEERETPLFFAILGILAFMVMAFSAGWVIWDIAMFFHSVPAGLFGCAFVVYAACANITTPSKQK